MLALKAIVQGQTLRTLPIVFDPKNDRFLLFYQEHRKLDAVTTLYSYLLPRMDEHSYYTGGGKILSTVDAKSCYLQIKCIKAIMRAWRLPHTIGYID